MYATTMNALRTKFKKEIVCEFLPPSRIMKHVDVELSRKRRKFSRCDIKGNTLGSDIDISFDVSNAKVIILASGGPGSPFKDQVMDYWSKRGYWVFNPRYRGTWESGGSFMAHEPTQDILYVMDGISQGFIEGWHSVHFKVSYKRLYLFGGSIGGPAVLLASHDSRVTKVVAIAPVVEWKTLGPAETFERFQSFTEEYFGNVYRGTKKDWKRLKDEKLYTPMKQVDQIDGLKCLIIQCKDDDLVPYKGVQSLAKKTKSQIKLYIKGGHIGTGKVASAPYVKVIEKFLKQK